MKIIIDTDNGSVRTDGESFLEDYYKAQTLLDLAFNDLAQKNLKKEYEEYSKSKTPITPENIRSLKDEELIDGKTMDEWNDFLDTYYRN